MAVTITYAGEFEFRGNDLRGNPCVFARDFRNFVFRQAFDFKTRIILEQEGVYNALPQFLKLQDSIVGIFSSGPAHAQSERQIMVRLDGENAPLQMVTFQEADVYDTSLLTDLIADGETETFKVFDVTNTGGVLTVGVQSTISYAGQDYAFWSKVRTGSDGKFYRTGYRVTAGLPYQGAVFVSTDKLNWSFLSMAFPTNGTLFFGEFDIVELSPGTWGAVCRESTGASSPCYRNISTDNMATWGSPVLYATTVLSGVQPNLEKLSTGQIICSLGGRVGVSGYSGDGQINGGLRTTGSSIQLTSDMTLATWGYRTNLAPMYSTDGGQPTTLEITPGRIWSGYYARRSTTRIASVGCTAMNIANLG